MDYYLEFTIKAKKPSGIPPVMSQLMNAVHHTLVKCRTDRVGVSFPDYSVTLGAILRVHGSEDHLKAFLLNLGPLPTGVSVTTIQARPSSVSWACFPRVRPGKQQSKLKSGLRSGHITDAKAYRIEMCQETLSEPYFFSHSTSTRQGYKRFVGRKLVTGPSDQGFDSFGMSGSSSVPVF